MNTLAFDGRTLARIGAFLALTLAVLLSWQSAQAGPQNLIRGLAIGGYDAVGYFESNDAIRGDPQFSHEWNGATWHFASAANRDKFATDPEAYAPQFGGHCAFAASLGIKTPGAPETWSIIDGRLFLNANGVAKGLWQALPGGGTLAYENWLDLRETP